MIIYEGQSLLRPHGRIVAIATMDSRNSKTGNMVQVWILPQNLDPIEALRRKSNRSICGDCGLQGDWDGTQISGRLCYVLLHQAPLQVWRAYKAGGYRIATDVPSLVDIVQDRDVRLGAYGDPAALPLRLLQRICSHARGWTGYSHQLFRINPDRANSLAKYLMCSCDDLQELKRAQRNGWRAFLNVPHGAEAPPDLIECRHSTHGVTCEQCLLCDGSHRKARSIWVRSHGANGAKHSWSTTHEEV